MTTTRLTLPPLTGTQTMNKQPEKKPRFLVIEGGRVKKDREEAARRAELQAFIKSCEALYEKKRVRREL